MSVADYVALMILVSTMVRDGRPDKDIRAAAEAWYTARYPQ